MLRDPAPASAPGVVTWLRPRSVTEALDLLITGATPVAGGAALLSPAFPVGMAERVVDVNAVLGSGVDAGVIGASTTLDDLTRLGAAWPAVAAAARLTATPQIRRVATVGGTVSARLPTSDLAAALAAHDCVVHVLTADGAEEIGVLDYLAAVTLPAHLVLGVRPQLSGPGAYRRFARQVGPAPAVATVAGVMTGGRLRMYAGAVGLTAAPVPLEPDGQPAQELRSDARAGADHRRHLVSALVAEVRAELEAQA